MAQQPRGLGRGLESLIPSAPKPQAAPAAAAPSARESGGAPFVTVSIDRIRVSRFQPRKVFNEEALQDLSNSIREQGLIQPLLVTPVEEAAGTPETYELIAGERRWRAAKMAGLSEVPIIVRKASDREQFQLALIENIQREDLNPIEEAVAFKRLMEEFNMTQEELSKAIGKGRVVIANALRLLNLPQDIQDAVASGVISAGHARNLASIPDSGMQKQVAGQILSENLTVRDVEKIVADWKSAVENGDVVTPRRKDPEVRQMEIELQQVLGTKVELRVRGKGDSIQGIVKIAYYSLADLERLVEIFKRK